MKIVHKKEFIKNIILPNIILTDSIKTLGTVSPYGLSVAIKNSFIDMGMIIQNEDADINLHKDVTDDMLSVIYTNENLYSITDAIISYSFHSKTYLYIDYFPSVGLFIKMLCF